MTQPLLVTGGLGFIGAAFIRRCSASGMQIVNVDLDTYAGDIRRLEGLNLPTRAADVAGDTLDRLIEEARPSAIVHLAAETHVTRSENDPQRFFATNVEGTRNVLEAAAKHGVERVVHVSTDEVYGPATDVPFTEQDKEPGEGRATSAYARSKAIADDLAKSYSDRLAVIVVRPTNCFGPWQHPEKAIPRWATRALTDRDIPVWGDGGYIRDWMYVEDAAAALEIILDRGAPGEIYNIAPQVEPRTNLEIAQLIASAASRDEGAVYLTEYDRPDHDRRYFIDGSKVRALGWESTASLDERIAQTVRWYAASRDWWLPMIEEAESLYTDKEVRSP